MPNSLDAALAALFDDRLRGDVLAVQAERWAERVPARRLERVKLGKTSDLLHVDGPFDAALIGGWGRELGPLEVARAVTPMIREGGSVVFVVTTARSNWFGAGGALARRLTRRASLSFEELCEAALRARLRDIVAIELPGAHGVSVVATRVQAPRPADVAESSVRSIGGREPSQEIAT